MALIDVEFDSEAFAIRAVQAGDADEMVTRLKAVIAEQSEDRIVDLQLAGAGAGPLWEAWLVFGDSTESISIQAEFATVVAAVAGNPAEATLRLTQKLAAVQAVTPIEFVAKVVVAGGGVGPTYMAVALASIAPPT